jgi:hypothetical protein
VLVAPDPVTGLGDEIGSVPRFLLQGLLVAGLLGGLASLIAAWTPRRAYATAGIIALFVIPPIVVGLVGNEASQDLARLLVLFSPGDILDGSKRRFGSIPDSATVAVGPASWAFLAAAATGIRLDRGTVRRYLRIATWPSDSRRARAPAGPPPALELDHVSLVATSWRSMALVRARRRRDRPARTERGLKSPLHDGRAAAPPRDASSSRARPPGDDRRCIAMSDSCPSVRPSIRT